MNNCRLLQADPILLNEKRTQSHFESQRKSDISKLFNSLSGSTDDTDIAIANEIKNFPIPNTKEDIFEFLILAATNIDPTAYMDMNKTRSEYRSKLAISEAWNAKYTQAFQKAMLTFPDDPKLININTLYHSKIVTIKKQKSNDFIPLIVFGSLILIMVVLLIYLQLH